MCDPALYFKDETNKEITISFNSWIKQMMLEFFELPQNNNKYEIKFHDFFGEKYFTLVPVLTYLLSGVA